MWKYGLIKIEYPDLWENEDGYHELVELYENANGDYDSFCHANINSLEELENVYSDIKRDGVNTWFMENGTFEWNSDEKCWDWKKNSG